MSIEGVKIRLRNYYIRATADKRRKAIKNTNFTVISNNCWGGLVYESYNILKQSPTVGLYFMPQEYLKFISNLEYYIKCCEIQFIEPEKARHRDFYAQDRRFGTFLIARLDDVEIAMLHYHSKEDAKTKWERRCARINWDRLIVKMNDQNGCTEEDAVAFGNLPYKNKLFFTVKKYDAGECTVRIPGHGAQTILSTQEPFGASKYFDVNAYLNNL